MTGESDAPATSSEVADFSPHVQKPCRRGAAFPARRNRPLRRRVHALWARTRGVERSHVFVGARIVPLRHRTLGRRQELAAQADLPGRPAVQGADPPVRPRRRPRHAEDPAAPAPPDRRGVPGPAAARAPLGLRQRRAAPAHRRGQARRLPQRRGRAPGLGGPGQSHARPARHPGRRREAAPGHRPRGGQPPGDPAGRRAHRQRRPRDGAQDLPAVRRAEPPGHHRGHRHPRPGPRRPLQPARPPPRRRQDQQALPHGTMGSGPLRRSRNGLERKAVRVLPQSNGAGARAPRCSCRSGRGRSATGTR
jgi:hypothetical protein